MGQGHFKKKVLPESPHSMPTTLVKASILKCVVTLGPEHLA